MNERFNTGETQDDLRNEYNPDGSNLRKAQMRLLDMAIYLFETAEKAGVTCWIESGNVLGSIRHGGFIPWDDDFDVSIFHSDFKKLCQYMKEHPHPQYILRTHESDSNCFIPWLQLIDLKSEYLNPYPPGSVDYKAFSSYKYRGMHIDIFSWEGRMIPKLQRLSGKMACVVNFFWARSCPPLARFTYWVLQNMVYPFFRILGYLFGKRNCWMCSYGAWFYFQYPKEVLFPLRNIQFEGHTFPGPANAHEFCRIMYGDYMNLPPKEKRQVHNNGILIKD